jgi:hypothetical protein
VTLFGLDAGTRAESSKVRRELAAEALGRKYETFRKKYERPLIREVAAQILGLCSEQHTRDARRSLERAESPEASAMPQVWLDRFAAYYRIWTPLNGLGNDLTAYRSTLLEPAEVLNRRYGTEAPDDPGYSQEEQAEGYASFALYHYADFEWQLRQFSTLYGGQWLLSDAEAEQAVADAVYRIFWHTPWNERDQSYLRSLIAETPDQELQGSSSGSEVPRSAEQPSASGSTGPTPASALGSREAQTTSTSRRHATTTESRTRASFIKSLRPAATTSTSSTPTGSAWRTGITLTRRYSEE